MSRLLLTRFLVFTACVGLIGCSSDELQKSQISGTVTFKGQPVPAGFISFTPDVAAGAKGSVCVVQIKDGKFDSSQETNPGVFPGQSIIRIAGYDGQPIKLYPQGKQIFNAITITEVIADGTSTKDFVIPESAGKNVIVEPTADE